jgi:glutathione S-transferase
VGYKSEVRLITMPFSHYSEKARWALDFSGLPYQEDAWLPMLHLLATVPAGGRSVPVLIDGGAVLPDSTDILMHVDRLAPDGRRLLPDSPAERAAVLDLEEYCDRHVGTASRSWIYSEMLSEPWAMGRRLGNGRPPLQKAILPPLMTLVSPGIIRSYRAQPERRDEWARKLRLAFDEIGRRLAVSSGPYLVGDRFTAADLTFAALAAPALLPPGHPGMRTPVETAPERVRSLVEELRATPAGRHALRMYTEHRDR